MDAASQSGESAGVPSHVTSRGDRSGDVEDADLSYVGPIRECRTCGQTSDTKNPLYLAKLPCHALTRRRFIPWCRYDSKGVPEGRLCYICVHVADTSYKSKGGRRSLSRLDGQDKVEFKQTVSDFCKKGAAGSYEN